jgi:hypothetical protein
VRATVGGQESEQELEVLPDPRREISMAERVEKQQAVRLGAELNSILQKVQAANRDLTHGLNQLDELLAADLDEHGQLRALADSVRGELGDVGSAMGELNQYRFALFSMGASRDAPTEAERHALARMEEGAMAVVDRFNGLIQGLVPELRRLASEARFDPIPELDPIRREELP